MIPSPWVGVVLVFAAYRLTRLVGWDDFPFAAKTRAWVTGQYWTKKQGDTELEWGYTRPNLAHLLACPFCQGFYISLGVYWLWVWQPHWSLVALIPFALSGAVGLIAKNWDA